LHDVVWIAVICQWLVGTIPQTAHVCAFQAIQQTLTGRQLACSGTFARQQI
jgi:hypothetical protein